MHNAVVNDGHYVRPPKPRPSEKYDDPSYATTAHHISTALQGIDQTDHYHYPTGKGFYSKDNLMALKKLNEANQPGERPKHLLMYDLRFIEPQSMYTTGNLLYNQNKQIQEEINQKYEEDMRRSKPSPTKSQYS